MNYTHQTAVRPLDDHGGLFRVDHPVTAPSACVRKFAGDTEIAAAEKIAPTAGKLRPQVLAWIVEAGDFGATTKELAATYARQIGCDVNDASARLAIAPRVSELKRLGLVKDGGRRRDGSAAWVAVTCGDDRQIARNK